MSLTPSDRHWHRVYEALPDPHRTAIDEGFRAMTDVLRESVPNTEALHAATDDRAEACVAAITRFVVESNPDDPAIKAALAQVEGEL